MQVAVVQGLLVRGVPDFARAACADSPCALIRGCRYQTPRAEQYAAWACPVNPAAPDAPADIQCVGLFDASGGERLGPVLEELLL